MAQESPSSVDVTNIQFKLHDKFKLFNDVGLKSNVQLLAVSSSRGLLFAGNSAAPELKVVMLKELVNAKSTGHNLHVRDVTLPSIPNILSCSTDGGMLAINSLSFLHIYSVPTFIQPDIKTLYILRLSPEDGVFATQLLWNPVLVNSIAAVLSNGALGMYTLKAGENYEMHILDKGQQVRCGSWSPKGKQIVLGFPNGKLQQFKPDLTPAKTINCPDGMHPAPFDTIAVHWLSTFQFVVAFLQQSEDASPSLYIVNAPKGGTPSYVNYYDICYSATGPRSHQIVFTHVQAWNLLLVTSANGVEVGILGTKETSETPTWVQYTMLDEARIEMPLTEAKDETYPMGFALDNSCTHQVKMGELELPVMPMVHVLSTHGHLVSFNFLNLATGVAGICSPPPPVTDTSGKFRVLNQLVATNETNTESKATINAAAPALTPRFQTGEPGFAFTPNAVTSTPTLKEKSMVSFDVPPVATTQQNTVPLFASPTHKPTVTQGFGTAGTNLPNVGGLAATITSTSQASGFDNFARLSGARNVAPFGGFNSTAPTTAQPHQKSASSVNQSVGELNKPLYTVPPSFVAPPSAAVQAVKGTSAQAASIPKDVLGSGEIDDIIKQMIALQINAFSLTLQQLRNLSKNLLGNTGHPDEMKAYVKRLNDLQEINEQAKDRDFELDVQGLRHSLNESYAMLAECRTKLDLYSNPDITRLTCISTFDPINRRQLAKLQSLLSINNAQLQQLQQQIDTQWSNYQDLVRRSSKFKMHIPCLDGIYQRMCKLKDLVGHQRNKLNCIRSKLKQAGLTYKAMQDSAESVTAMGEKSERSIDSLADSILSMTLSHIVEAQRSKLSTGKLDAIRNFARQQQEVTIIRPHRPDRVGLNSEVILETKLQNNRRAIAREQPEKQQPLKDKVSFESPKILESQLAKPTATKPVVSVRQTHDTFAPPLQAQTATPSFSFGNTSPFVKTAAAGGPKPEETLVKPFAVAATAALAPQSSFATPASAFTTGQTVAGFGPMKPTVSATATATTKSDVTPKESPAAMQVPLSFAAKVVGGDAVPTSKPFGFGVSSSTKPPSPTAALPDKENKLPSEDVKKVSVAGTAPTGFGGFTAATSAATSTATATAIATKSSIFNGKPNLSSGGSFNFGGASNFFGGITTPFAALSTNIAATTAKTTTATNEPTFTFTLGGTGTKPNIATVAGTTASIQEGTLAAVTATAPATSAGFKFEAVNLKTTSTALSAASTTTTTFPATAALRALAVSSIPLSTAPANTAATNTVATVSATSTSPVTSTSGNNPVGSLFDNLNICKPTTKEDTGAPFGISSGAFSFTGGASDANTAADANASKSIFGTTTLPTTKFTFGGITSTAPASTVGTFSKATPADSAGTETVAASITTTTSSTGTTTPSTMPLFGQLSATTTTAPAIFRSETETSMKAAATTAAASVATTTTPTSAFGSGSSIFTSIAPENKPTPPTVAAPASAANSIFAAAAVASASVQGAIAATTTAVSVSPFGSVSANASTTAPTTSPFFNKSTDAVASTPTTTTGGIFSGIPKPEQSVFGSPLGNTVQQQQQQQPIASSESVFASSPFRNTTSPAGSAVTSGGSIFGGASSTFGATPATGASIFGGGSSAAAATNTSPFSAAGNTNSSSIFGGAAKPGDSANVFGAASQTSGSVFGQNIFSQAAQSSGGNIFEAAQQQPSGGFGSGASIFGGASTGGGSGGSIFGGSTPSAFGAAPGSGGGGSGFSAFSQPAASTAAFGSPTAAGSFAQGGASVAQTGFGSPQQAASFAKPVFGAAATFGSPPAFGTQPSFGGAPTFGSPKGFGTFSVPTAPAAPGGGAFGSPTQKSNLFEALGSTDSGLSFGNLAQASNANAQKPTFGGSSFMNYRA